MSKIPTAEEFYKQTTGCIINHGDVKTAMIEFAKLHVEAALEEASKKAVPVNGAGERSYLYVDKDSILQSYPLTNIK